MGKKKKVKKKCCEKYLKSGKHCKNCPEVQKEAGKKKKGKKSGKKADKKKQSKKKKK